jgi:hypothetical protein
MFWNVFRDRHDQHQMHNGSVIQANQVYLNEAANVHEKEPLAASTTATITRYWGVFKSSLITI